MILIDLRPRLTNSKSQVFFSFVFLLQIKVMHSWNRIVKEIATWFLHNKTTFVVILVSNWKKWDQTKIKQSRSEASVPKIEPKTSWIFNSFIKNSLFKKCRYFLLILSAATNTINPNRRTSLNLKHSYRLQRHQVDFKVVFQRQKVTQHQT